MSNEYDTCYACCEPAPNHRDNCPIAVRDAEIARLNAELAEAKAQLNGAFVGLRDMKNLWTSANADADLLGREANAWRAEYKKWNDGNHHFHEPFDAVADTDARPTAAARVKGSL